MSKKSSTFDNAEWHEPENAPVPEPNDWVRVVDTWTDKSDVKAIATRLQAELAREGITTLEDLAAASVQRVASAARAAIQADAQALLAAAHKLLQGG
jgi:cytosine/adenosine deaminase-related metal-dependent hydrolase